MIRTGRETWYGAAFRSAARLVPLVTLAAIVTGLLSGRHYPSEGFPLLLLESVRQTLRVALPGLLLFLVLSEIIIRLTERRLGRLAAWLGGLVGGAPLLAWVGFELAYRFDIRPSEVLEPYALERFGALLAVGGIASVGAGLALSRRHLRPGLGPWPAILMLVTAAMLEGVLAWSFRTVEKQGPDVIVVLIDALRADHVGAYGYHRSTTPALDDLCRDAIVFRQAISQSTYTKTSIASLFTGRNPYRHGVYRGGRERAGAIVSDVLRDDETTLAEALADAGYLTSAWVHNSTLQSYFGFDQGFVDYRDQQGHAPRITARLRRWLRGPARRYNYFAYVHFIDLHGPYRPRPPYDSLFGDAGGVYDEVNLRQWGAYLRSVRDGEVELSTESVAKMEMLYDGLLRDVDDHVALIFDELRRADLYDDTLIIVTSDHGDAFLEHGVISHSSTPYDELIRVPLIVKLPRSELAGRVVTEQVRLVDVMPFVLDELGVDTVDLDFDGCPLGPVIAGEARPARCEEAVSEVAANRSYPILTLRTTEWKYIHFGDAPDEVYDLVADPRETVNLASGLPKKTQSFRERALALVALRPRHRRAVEVDAETARALRALGYLDDGDRTSDKSESE